VDVATIASLRAPEGARLLGLIPPYDESTALSLGARLRRDGFSDELVAAALTQARLRALGRVKFGPDADRMLFTSAGLEQATRREVAAGHAARFAASGVGSVADLCCGIGGDLQQLAGALDRVLGVDRDPVTAAVAQANVDALGLAGRTEIWCDDVAAVDLDGWDGVFIDPSRRRAGGRRTFDPSGYSPPYGVVLDLAGRVPATGAKLAPGIPHEVLPADAEAEWVSDGGDVVECALWFGPLASGVPRRATLLPSGATLTADAFTPGEVGPVRRYLYEPDGAVIRAGLVAEAAALVEGNLVDQTIAYVTADALVATPFMTAYEVTDVMPFGLKRLRTLLRERGVGRLTVKKRGSAITPESLRQQLRLSGPEEATIVLTRVAGAATVLLVQPI
jgi:hypothetical protein